MPSRFAGSFAETFGPLGDAGPSSDWSVFESHTETMKSQADHGNMAPGSPGVSCERTAFLSFFESVKPPADGCETMEPASDGTGHLSSSESSDDFSLDAECIAPPCIPPSYVPSMPANTNQDSLLRGGPGGIPRWKPLPEEGLVDLDPVEGQRRGTEIMAILQAVQAKSLPPTDDRKKHANREQVEECGSSSNYTSWPPLMASCGDDEVHAWPRTAALDQSCASRDLCLAASQSWPIKCDLWRNALFAAIHDAATRVYGSDFLGVLSTASGGFAVRLRDGWEQWNAWALIDDLSSALCPLLGPQVVSIGSSVASSRAQLILELLCEDADGQSKYCWSFIKYGMCSRGDRCRWKHTPQPTCRVCIEITC